jgi:hypothetical protein
MEGTVTHQPTSSLPRRRTLATLAAAFSIALVAGLTSACLEAPEPEDDVETFAFLAFDCSSIPSWKVGLNVGASGQVQHLGGVFESVLKSSYTVAAENWAPPLASLWRQIGSCGGQQQPPAQEPPAQQPQQPEQPEQPPAQQPPAQQPPPANNGGQNLFAPNDPNTFNQLTCRNANGVVQPFDAAGETNGQIGARKGGQFITGRCTSNADCGSNNCAFPCGVCSGPAVVGKPDAPINGKTGSGFFCPAGTEGRTCGQQR